MYPTRRRTRFAQEVGSTADAKDKYGDVDVSDTTVLRVPNELREVGDSGGHAIGKSHHGDNLDASVGQSKVVEDGHLRADIMDHEVVLAELHLDAKFFLDEIHLAERAPRLVRRLVAGDVLVERTAGRNLLLFPSLLEEHGREHLVHGPGVE